MSTQTPEVFVTFVHVADAAGENHAFNPGDPIPDWARPLVGDHVIGYRNSAEMLATWPELGAIDETDRGFTGDLTGTVFRPDVEEPTAERPPPPPTSGPGSGQATWYAWAEQVGAAADVGMTRSWTRQDIIDTLIRRGYLTDLE